MVDALVKQIVKNKKKLGRSCGFPAFDPIYHDEPTEPEEYHLVKTKRFPCQTYGSGSDSSNEPFGTNSICSAKRGMGNQRCLQTQRRQLWPYRTGLGLKFPMGIRQIYVAGDSDSPRPLRQIVAVFDNKSHLKDNLVLGTILKNRDILI